MGGQKERGRGVTERESGSACRKVKKCYMAVFEAVFVLPAGWKGKQSSTLEHLVLGFSTEMEKSAWHTGRFHGVTSPLGNQPEKYQKQSQKWLSGECIHLLPTRAGLEHMT